MPTLFSYFTYSLLVAIIGFSAAFFMGGTKALFLVAVLAILEVSLSFDNAVVNASVLRRMAPIWRKRFLTWGILIAVFGMRIVFPILIVSIVAGISPWSALFIAMHKPDQYTAIMASAHIDIMAFGGTFLMMVGLTFFFRNKETHWIPPIEKALARAGKYTYLPVLITLACLALTGLLALDAPDRSGFALSGITGILLFLGIHVLNTYMETRVTTDIADTALKSGVSMFIYLEVLDASFSFDAVIGALAITTDLFIIAIGLVIGAMFVRSLTILMVEKNTLGKYIYLEHGAFYAIIALAIIMLIKTFIPVSETFTGLVGAGFIALAFIHSLVRKKTQTT